MADMHDPAHTRATSTPGRSGSARRMRTVNVRLLAGTIASVVAIGVGAFFLHRYQVNRNAEDIIAQADIFERQGKLVEAAAQLNQYIALVGPRTDVLVKLSRIVEQDPQKDLNETRLLLRLYGRILGLDPDQVECRRKMARLLLETGSATRAAEEAQEVIRRLGDDVESQRILGDAAFAQEKFNEAVPHFESVLRSSPKDISSHIRLATCYIRSNLTELAKEVLDRMIQENKEYGEAYYQRFLFRRAILKEDASEDMRRALELGPDNPDFMLAAGGDALSKRHWKQSIDFFDKVMTTSRNQDTRSAALLGLGNAYVGMGRIDDAVKFWERSLHELGPRSLPIRLRLTEVLLENDRIEAAGKWVKELREQERQLTSMASHSPADLNKALQLIDWIEARYHLAAGAPERAIPLLVSISQSNLGDDATRHAALAVLANIYAQNRQWDAVCDALEQALAIKPGDVACSFNLAAAMMESGRATEAQNIYERLAANTSIAPDAWVPLARIRLIEEVALPPDKRHWEHFESAMSKAKAASGLEPVALAVTHLVARQRHPEAQILLAVVDLSLPFRWARVVATKLTSQAGLWLTRTLKGAPSGAPAPRVDWAAMVDSWRREWSLLEVTRVSLLAQAGWDGPATTLAALLSDFWPGNGRFLLLSTARKLQESSPADALQYLQERLPNMQGDDLGQGLRMKELLASRMGDRRARRQALEQLISLRPNDLETRLALFDDHLAAGDIDEARRDLEGITAVEGAGGTHVLYARAMLELATGSRNAGVIKQLDDLASQLVRLRPRWGRTQFLQAAIARIGGNREREIHYLEGAIAARFRRADVFQRLLVLLLAKRDLAQADRYLAMLTQESIRSPDFLPIALQVSMSQQHFDVAEKIASQAVAERPDDARALIWLGNVQRTARRFAEAEASYRRAIKVDPAHPDGHAALITLLASQSRRKEALAEIEAIKSAGAAGKEPEALLGLCYAILGKNDEAKLHFLLASTKYPLNLAVQQQAAAFFLSRQMPEAMDVIARLKALKPEDPSVRYGTAIHLLFQPSAKSWREGVELLRDHDSPYDLRLKAMLLDRLGGVDERREAIEHLERLLTIDPDATPRDRLNLAQLLDRDGRTAQSIAVLEPVLSSGAVPPDILASSIRYLLALGKLENVESLFAALEREPSSVETNLLKLRWQHAQQDSKGVEHLARSMVAEAKDQEAAMSVLDTLIAIEETDLAESLFVGVTQRFPKSFPLRMLFLARKGRADDAVKECHKLADESPGGSSPFLVLAAKLTSAYRVSPETASLAARRLEELIASDASNSAREAMAELRLIEGDFEAAEKIYRGILDVDSPRPAALNNYALALAKLGKHGEANQQLFLAIEVAGPRPELLDTKAVLAIEAGRPRDAIRILRPLISDPRCGSLTHLHMAIAQARAGQAERSKESIQAFEKKHPLSERLSAGDQEYLRSLDKPTGANR